MTFNELPKKRIQDFFAAGDPTGTAKEKPHTEKAKREKKKRCRLVTYVEEDQYERFLKACEERDITPAMAIRQLVRLFLNGGNT